MKNIHKIHVGSFWLFLTTFSSILAMQIFRLIPPFVRIFCSITFLLCNVDVLLFDICVYCVSFCLHVSEIHRLIVVIMAEIIWSRGRPVELLLDVHQILLDVQQDSTGFTLEFCKFALNFSDLPISQRNVIKKFYWMSSRISIGRPLESTGRPVELGTLQDVNQSRRFGGLYLIFKYVRCILLQI